MDAGDGSKAIGMALLSGGTGLPLVGLREGSVSDLFGMLGLPEGTRFPFLDLEVGTECLLEWEALALRFCLWAIILCRIV